MTSRVARQFSREKAKRRQKRTKKKPNTFLSENCGKIIIFGKIAQKYTWVATRCSYFNKYCKKICANFCD